MCGIIGYIGTQKAKPILIDGLTRLEYRGFDSVGISTIEESSIKTIKTKGRIHDLINIKEIDSLNGTIGIGHTRWATHGVPSAINSHPHLDNSNSFSVVHNGIIENYAEIKELLINNGYTFLSTTDTEVIPNLIHYKLNQNVQKENISINTLSKDKLTHLILKSINESLKELSGSYALEILTTYLPDCIFVTRKDSPLVIGTKENEFFISSDIPTLVSFTKEFYFLDNFESALIEKNNINFYDYNLNIIDKELKDFKWDVSIAEKEGFEDYMLKEIFEQPKAIRETIGSRISSNTIILPEINLSKEYLKSINKINLIACGTAMHAGLATKRLFESLLNIQTQVEIASEFRYSNPLIDEKTLCIFISQSGETADTLAALHLAKSNNAKTIAISNVIGSTISREADFCIYTHAGPEIAVASTKAYTSQIVLLTILSMYLAQTLGNNNPLISSLCNELLSLPKKVDTILKNTDQIKQFSNKVFNETDMYFIGRLEDYAASLEGSLKLKEISYIHSEAYAAGELKHGPIALIEDNVTVLSIITNPETAPKTLSNLQEVITRGAKIFIITNQELENINSDNIFKIPEVSIYLSPILSVIPLQLYAYYISKSKKLDVDKPRNLAKSVTVE